MTLTRTVRLGTRRSLLATTQSGVVADLIRGLGAEVELVEITSDGDRSQASGASLVGTSQTGVFVNALRDALLAGEIDVAVHSLKDLPTAPHPQLVLAAIPTREDPRDVLVARDGLTLATLPAGARVGTGAPRRSSQVLAARPDLDLVAIRGNVDTRVGRVTSGELDAVVVAAAGLARLGRLGEATELLDPDTILPAPGQGALAVEMRDPATGLDGSDEGLFGLLNGLDDAQTRFAVVAERAVLATLEGGCAAPIGTLAEVVETDAGQQLRVRATALSLDGATVVRGSGTGACEDAAGIGTRCAKSMLAAGAAELVTR